VRYSLFLCASTVLDVLSMLPPANTDLAYLEGMAARQLEFCARALSLLDDASDTDLAGHATAYRRLLLMHAAGPNQDGGEQLLAGAGLCVEVMWRTHMIHPVAYLRACAMMRGADNEDCSAITSLEWSGGIDLIAAARRSCRFMRGILANRQSYEAPGALTEAVQLYQGFLMAAAHSHVALVPTQSVDLVWHAHQQQPQYAAECVAVSGRLLDHDDTVGEAELAAVATVVATMAASSCLPTTESDLQLAQAGQPGHVR